MLKDFILVSLLFFIIYHNSIKFIKKEKQPIKESIVMSLMVGIISLSMSLYYVVPAIKFFSPIIISVGSYCLMSLFKSSFSKKDRIKRSIGIGLCMFFLLIFEKLL